MPHRTACAHVSITPETLRAMIELTYRFGDDLRRSAIELARKQADEKPAVTAETLLHALPLALESLRESVTRENPFGGLAHGRTDAA